MTSGIITTFYSYKGGVGRSMSLANIACILAGWGNRVLCVDGDLEAPGLHYYFKTKISKLKSRGFLEMLLSYRTKKPVNWRDIVYSIKQINKYKIKLDFINAGMQDSKRSVLLKELDWDELYIKHGLALELEVLCNEWKESYDHILIDSRTGITDIGGVLTIQIPDQLFLFCTPNQQGIDGLSRIAKQIKSGRSELPLDRPQLPIMPVITSFAGRFEKDLGERWLAHFVEELGFLFNDWLHRDIKLIHLLNQTKIPYVPRWSFGEELPVLAEDGNNVDEISYSLTNIASLLEHRLVNNRKLVEAREDYIKESAKKGLKIPTPSINPFFYGSPIDTDQFMNRVKALNRIVGRILNRGQSTAIVGEPHMGKSSLLKYLAATETRVTLYGNQKDRLIFSMVDIQMLGAQFSQPQFWEQALTPLVRKVIKPRSATPLADHYNVCKENRFGTFALEQFFKQLHKSSRCLVLLLDEFDMLLTPPILNSSEFFGSLRALISCSKGALSVVAASRQSLSAMNSTTQKFNPTGSPYFNIFTEVHLGIFPKKDVTVLLNRAGERFLKEDREYITAVAGGHPYLLQTAASIMWEEIVEGNADTYHRYLMVGKRLYRENKLHFSDTWSVWSPYTRRAVTTIALAHIPCILKDHAFSTKEFIKDLPDLSPELNELKSIGLILEDDDVPGGYRIAQGAILWWLSDELIHTLRKTTTFEKWLSDQEMVGLLTKKEIVLLGKAAKYVGSLLHRGASTLIDAYAKGLAG